jgi:hypothetical protein
MTNAIDDTRVIVNLADLRHVLDYLHDSEGDHYNPEDEPEHAENHVYKYVLAIEEGIKDAPDPTHAERCVSQLINMLDERQLEEFIAWEGGYRP